MVSLREKVQFRMNQPVRVALAYEDGVFKQDDRFGDYWMYTLEDERIMFVPPVVHEQIKQRRIESGQKFTITKVPARCGHRRGLDWVVDVGTETAEVAAEHTSAEVVADRDSVEQKDAEGPPAPNGAQASSDGATRLNVGERSAPVVAQTEGAGRSIAESGAGEGKNDNEVQPNASGKPNGSGAVSEVDANRVKANGIGVNGAAKSNGIQPAMKPRTSPLFKAAMQAAIDAMIEGEQYASERNYSVRFTSEDLRASAISIFISMRDGGYR
jgi:hypothetical protein